MDVLSEEDKFLEEQTLEAYAAMRRILLTDADKPGKTYTDLIIDEEKFLETHPAIRRRIVEKSCWKMGVRPTYEQICTLDRVL